jgi:hypothetical protein
MTIAAFSRSLGLFGAGLYKDLRQRKIHLKKHGKYRIISLDQIEKYLRLTESPNVPRVPCEPPGWITTKEASDIIGVAQAVVLKAAADGRIKAVRRAYVRYYDPDSVEDFRLEYNHYPLPGWISVTDFSGAAGAHRSGVIRWLKKNRYEIRRFRHPEKKQKAAYALRSALEAWLEHRSGG